MTRSTIPEVFQQSVEQHGDRTALLHVVGRDYAPVTYNELARRAEQFAFGLLSLGIQPGDRIGVISENRPEWAAADLGMLSIGAVNTPVFTTLPPAQLRYLFRDSGTRLVLVSDAKQLAKMLAIRDDLPDLERLIVLDAQVELPDDGVLRFDAVTPPADAVEELTAERQRRLAALQPDDLASIIYTSGTTGEPKGAMLTHWNFVSNAQAARAVIDVGPADRYLSFLPLNHVFERLVGHYLMLFSGVTVAYAESLFTLPNNMRQVRPTIMAGVPRFYETTAARLHDETRRGPATKRRVMAWALQVADRWARQVTVRRFPGVSLSLQHWLADKLVYGKVRQTFGGSLRILVSGGAALPPDLNLLFHGLGLELRQGYGLTETSPVISVNPGYQTLKVGTAGPPVPGVEVRIAEDGEILSRGPHIMKGYWNRPEDTAEVIDGEGWFYTGDIGHLDEDGHVVITDRKKNLLVLANGKNVAPAAIENKLKSSPLIAEVIAIGDGQKSVTALIVPDFDALRALAKEEGVRAETNQELVAADKANRAITAELKRLSIDFADFEKVRKFRLLDRELTVDSGELTPTLKVKRAVMLERHAELIQSMAE